MAKFQKGDYANAIATNGQEVKVQIVDILENGRFVVQIYDEQGVVNGPLKQAEPSALLPLRGPYFEVRGLVLTTSSKHPGEIGEIVRLGTSKSGKAFYFIQFADGSGEWLSEDHVFIENSVLPPEAVKSANRHPEK